MKAIDGLFSKNIYKLALLAIGAFLFLVGYYFRVSEQLDFYRITRGIISFTFLLYIVAIHKGRSSNLISFYMLLCGIIGLFGMWFEYHAFRLLIIVLSAYSLILLAVYVSPKIKKRPLSKWFLILAILITLLNSFLLFQFIEVILDGEEENGVYTVMLIYALLVVLISLLVLIYNKIKKSNASFYFTMSWFVLVISEVLRAAGYYEVGYDDVFVHLSRALFILSNILLVCYTMVSKSEKPAVVSYI